jgi:hypothetical protein
MTWNAILEESRLPLLTQFGTRLDMTETQISTPGALNLEQICTMLDAVSGLDEQTALILPGGFLYGIDARTVRKNLRVVQLRRFKSKREAIQSQSTPDQLIQERLEEMRKAYQSDQDKLRLDYGGINYRGITSNRTNNYSISDAIRGYLHAQLADDLIDVRRYD